MSKKSHVTAHIFLVTMLVIAFSTAEAQAREPIEGFQVRLPVHIREFATAGPTGLTPTKVRTIYNLPATGGAGKTIALIEAYDYRTCQNDLTVFSRQFGLPVATTANGLLEIHKMVSSLRADPGWALEAALDTQWAHAIAPSAKILVVEARSASGTDLLSAVNYARNRSDVVAISMSWGGNEFAGEGTYDSTFTSPYGATFFASSGDSGYGVSWPAVSPNVVGVGGTSVVLDINGALLSETAWSGSGGGLSAYVTQPAYQGVYGVPNANGKRAVPDVSYNADPNSGFSIYDTTSYLGQTGWFKVGGTSAGAPQWAAIIALGGKAADANFYTDALLVNPTTGQPLYSSYFRDILAGSNGTPGVYTTAQPRYDYVTGLGSPVTVKY